MAATRDTLHAFDLHSGRLALLVRPGQSPDVELGGVGWGRDIQSLAVYERDARAGRWAAVVGGGNSVLGVGFGVAAAHCLGTGRLLWRVATYAHPAWQPGLAQIAVRTDRGILLAVDKGGSRHAWDLAALSAATAAPGQAGAPAWLTLPEGQCAHLGSEPGYGKAYLSLPERGRATALEAKAQSDVPLTAVSCWFRKAREGAGAGAAVAAAAGGDGSDARRPVQASIAAVRRYLRGRGPVSSFTALSGGRYLVGLTDGRVAAVRIELDG